MTEFDLTVAAIALVVAVAVVLWPTGRGAFALLPGEPTEGQNRAAYRALKASGRKLAGYMPDVDYTRM